MARFARNSVILLKAESAYGTDASPAATNAMLVSNLTHNPLNAQNVPRELITGYMGGFEHLPGNRFVEIGFDIELVGSGTAGTAPSWTDALKACGWAETATTGTAARVDYTLVSGSFTGATIYWHDDGVKHAVVGARGNVGFKLNAGGRPIMSYQFKGLYSTPSSAANPTPVYTGFKVPLVVAEVNTADLTFGGTHATTGAPAITSGTAYPSLGIEFDLGNSVEHQPLLGGESVEITNRDPSASFQLEVTAAQEVTLMGSVASATLQSVGLIHGTAAGYKSLLWLPQVQLINPRQQEMSGRRLLGFDARPIPSTGNDEARLVLF